MSKNTVGFAINTDDERENALAADGARNATFVTFGPNADTEAVKRVVVNMVTIFIGVGLLLVVRCGATKWNAEIIFGSFVLAAEDLCARVFRQSTFYVVPHRSSESSDPNAAAATCYNLY